MAPGLLRAKVNDNYRVSTLWARIGNVGNALAGRGKGWRQIETDIVQVLCFFQCNIEGMKL